MQQHKNMGGLKLVNLKYKEWSLKLTWPQILLSEKTYSIMVYKLIHPIKELIWCCTLHLNDLSQLKIKSPFWNDVVHAWCQLNFSQKLHIENQVIWLNLYIRIQNKVLYWADCKKRGLNYVHQLFRNGMIKPFLELYHDFGLDAIRLNGLYEAIPNAWKIYFKNNDKLVYLPLQPNFYYEAIQKSNLSQYAYSEFIQRLDENLLEKKQVWQNRLSVTIDTKEFCKYFTNYYSVTNVNKYRSFQYRLLQGAIKSNAILHKWGIKDTPNCQWCTESDSTMHMLINCIKVKELWKEVFDYIESTYEQVKSKKPENIIFNNVSKKNLSAANMLVLVTKQYIYRQRCMMLEINYHELKQIFHNIENTEKYIAQINGKQKKHEIKLAKASIPNK